MTTFDEWFYGRYGHKPMKNWRFGGQQKEVWYAAKADSRRVLEEIKAIFYNSTSADEEIKKIQAIIDRELEVKS